jgi:hypothetical protein
MEGFLDVRHRARELYVKSVAGAADSAFQKRTSGLPDDNHPKN